MSPLVRALCWQDVDPLTHPFDPTQVAEIARAALPDRPIKGPGMDERQEAAEARVDRALLAELGAWIAGWNWAASEPGAGGPVREYCCAQDSLVGSPEEMVARIVAATTDWRARLEDLSREFSRLHDENEGREIDDSVSRAAARLLPLVLEWTGAEDAWYSTFERLLTWYLEPILPDTDRALAIVQQAISGRFASWIAPDESVASAVVQDLGGLVASESGRVPVEIDCLHEWIKNRERVGWPTERYYRPNEVHRDGHLHHIETIDQARDPERAGRMLDALTAARAAARAKEPLSFDLLRSWQHIVLGEPCDFRGASAWAHGGSERYGLHARTFRRFERCLAEAADPALPAVVRAARVYLDVCYFHPFPDGNARSARLALDYVLTANGLALHAASPVFLVARRALDRAGAYSFQLVVDHLAGPIASNQPT